MSQKYTGVFKFINGSKTKAIIIEKKVISASPLKVEPWGHIRYVYGSFSTIVKGTTYTYTYSPTGTAFRGDNRTIVIQ